MNEVAAPADRPRAVDDGDDGARPAARFSASRDGERISTRVMGVLNTTPDSFSDGGRWVDPDRAVEHGARLFAAGAAVVDVGGESTRPGAAPVPDEEQIRRVVPVIERLAELGEVSIDTRSSAVARAAVRAGATIINDVSASLERVAAELGTGWVAMHMRGTPQTMQRDTRYEDVVATVCEFLVERARRGAELGIDRIWIDPGFGFGKTPTQNLQLLSATDRLAASGFPVMVGTSRKSTLGILAAAVRAGLDEPAPQTRAVASAAAGDRLEMSIVTALLAASLGADMVRVHDVEATLGAFAAFNDLLKPAADVPHTAANGHRDRTNRTREDEF